MGGKLLGIDIGSTAIKFALCKNGTMLGAAVVDMPEGLFANDRITDLGRFATLLRNTIKENKLYARRACLVVSSEVCFLRELTLPRMTVEQLEKNLPYEFSNYIDGDLKEYLFDYEMLAPVGQEDETMQVMAVALPGAVLEQMREFLRRARMKLVRVAPNESAFQALIRQATAHGSEQTEYCFMNLGYHATRMFMFQKDRHMATRVLETGLSSLETVVSEKLEIERAEAHRCLLENRGGCQREEYSMEIYRDIAVELMRALNFYRFSNPDSTLEDIYLSGGGAAIEPLRETISETLGTRIHDISELLQMESKIPFGYFYPQAVGVTIDWK